MNSRSMAVACCWVIGCALGWAQARAQILDHVVRPTAEAGSNGIVLRWSPHSDAVEYEVSRRASAENPWEDPVTLPGSATEFVDAGASPGVWHEYRIIKYGRADAEAYLRAGFDLGWVDHRGVVLLLVDATLAGGLALELRRLELDLVGDGWSVVRREVPRASVSPGDATPAAGRRRLEEIAQVKAVIRDVHESSAGPVRTVFLMGHVPVPYSGDMYPDGHTDHRGAWPCDAYYGDLEGEWTDEFVSTTSAQSARNRNLPGDGKFDGTQLPGPLALEVGRVDMANLPAVGEELALLKRYLDKNHDFRQGRRRAERRGIIDDRLGLSTGEPLSASAWSAFSTFFGPTNVVTGPLMPSAGGPSVSVLWGYGAAGGSYTSAGGVISSQGLATAGPGAVFVMLFGSYFGDWDVSDNLLRAVLAAPENGLACVWSGRPQWQFHPLALGETLGYCARLNQNNTAYYQSYARFANVALMGDPTLRMHVVPPPTALEVSDQPPGQVRLRWQAPVDPPDGYLVFRALNPSAPFVRLNSQPLTPSETEYVDLDPVGAENACYLVRALRKERSRSGDYLNTSQGTIQDRAGSHGSRRLEVTRDSNGVVLSWSANTVDVVLEESDVLAPAGWTRSVWPVALDDEENRWRVGVDATHASRFFRLRGR